MALLQAPHSLTPQQQQAYDKINAFLDSSSSHIFILNGYAGTGKTFLMKYIVERLLAEQRRVVLMAPTGRAARILGNKAEHGASTIHRRIYGFVKEGLTSKDAYIINFKLAANEDPDNTVYIVDEASMVSDTSGNSEVFRFGSGRILSDLLTYIDLQGTKRKLIFVGDNAQLPPVEMKHSPALDRDGMAHKFNVRVESTTMNEVVRQQQHNSILKLATGLRQQIERAVPNSVHIASDGNQVLEADPAELRTSYAKEIRDTDFPGSIWICQTNKATIDVNEDIRAGLGYLKQAIEPGELLMVTQNNYTKDVLLMNGDLVKADTVSTRREVHTVIFNYRQRQGIRKELVFRDVAIRHSQYPEINLSVKVLENSLYDDEDQILNAALFVLCKQQYSEDNKGLDFKTFKKQNPYYTCLKVRYGYAITCHKAQGGEWDRVIVDFHHLAGIYSKEFLRWAYTATTRSSGKLWVLNPVYADALSGFVVNQVVTLRKRRMVEPAVTTAAETDTANAEGSGGTGLLGPFPFLKPALQKMEAKAADSGYALQTELMNYRIRNTLSGVNGALCRWDMLYTSKYLKPDITGLKILDEAVDAAKLSQHITDAAFAKEDSNGTSSHEEALVSYPDERRVQLMTSFLTSCCEQVDVKIIGFVALDWQDIWLLQTDEPEAELGCFYNKNERYTSIEPRSLKGGYDKKLMKLTELLALK